MLKKYCTCDICKKDIKGHYETFIHVKKINDRRLKIQICNECFNKIQNDSNNTNVVK